MNNSNFLSKELVNTFAYTTATKNRDAYTNVCINGRNYIKLGTLQAVTIVGNLYKINNNGNIEYVLLAGMSKQHPCDSKVNKEMGYELANENANTDPFLIMKVSRNFTKTAFANMMTTYIDSMKLEFVKTTQEILAEGIDKEIYDR